ncbi:MAG: TIM barrel protein [Bacteroidales bacterium]|jgi:sugar phosphate isomerase/epimerase|nr:TIM barrel protein [Bacteroidales bacterium]
MKRRAFIQTAGVGIAATLAPNLAFAGTSENQKLRLGGPVYGKYSGPDEWVHLLQKEGYRAAYCPIEPGATSDQIQAYANAAKKGDIVISEVGAWSNPISGNSDEANAAIKKCIEGLQLAEEIGANCCVNVSGSRNSEHWAGPHKDNLTEETFDMVVEVTRKIIDAVNPTRTVFALEAMPWSFPDSTDTYLRLVDAIDRKGFGVHLDPVNMIRSPREYYGNGKLIKEMFAKLGPHIRSCHAKDIALREDNYIPQLDEVRAGLGTLDYAVFLKELSKLKDVPLMMEHLNSAEEYRLAAEHIRGVGKSVGLGF